MTNLKPLSKKPIYVVGLPRSGTTWTASILNTADRVKYFYEPFNTDQVPEAVCHWNKYLLAGYKDQEFNQFCQDAFSGRVNRPAVLRKLAPPYRWLRYNLRWLPGRVMVKDVHSLMSLDWIDSHISPTTIILMRHPCAVAGSWFHTFKPTFAKGNIKGLERLLEQSQLFDDYLGPFETLLKEKGSFWHKVGHYWGAVYFVLLQQQKHHPDWIVIQHEQLCLNPMDEFRKLFDTLQLRWTQRTNQILQTSTTSDSGRSYVPSRVSSQEPEKWKQQLEAWQIEEVQAAVKPFGLPYYTS
ncbi:MAG: sulfotransferase [Cyanobacteria bacterium P01_A01_bin.17]